MVVTIGNVLGIVVVISTIVVGMVVKILDFLHSVVSSS